MYTLILVGILSNDRYISENKLLGLLKGLRDFLDIVSNKDTGRLPLSKPDDYTIK